MRRGIVVTGLLLATACAGGDEAPADGGGSGDAGLDLRDGSASGDDAGARDAGAAPDSGTADSGVVEFASVDELLAGVPGLTATERGSPPDGYRVFDVVLEQPIDHFGESPPGTFGHHGILFVRSTDAASAPLVLIPNAYYYIDGEELSEVTILLGANQLTLEGRYFGASIPADPAPYVGMTVENIVEDTHAWISQMTRFFGGRVISESGNAFWGLTTWLRAFHPDDVYASIDFGTVDIDGPFDQRWADALRTWGPSDCRGRVDVLQLDLLGARRQGVMAGIANHASMPTFTRLGGPERAYEAMVLDLADSFWGFYGYPFTCENLPDGATARDFELVEFFDALSLIWLADDATQNQFEPEFYVRHRQLGFRAIPTAHLAAALTTDAQPAAEGNVVDPPPFDPTADAIVDEFMETRVRRWMNVFGAQNSWSAVRYPVDAEREVIEVGVPGRGTIDFLWELPPATRSAVEAQLLEWASD